jgi:Fur family peroxide stress response transcriptional regulator
MRKQSKDQMVKALKDARYRITRQRMSIIKFIAERPDHPNAQQIHREINTGERGISLATIYNTLKTLVENNLIKEIDFEDNDNRYDTNLEPHINLVCTVCGSISDYNLDLPISPDEIKIQKGFITTDFRIEYRGVCTQCGRNNR